MWRRRAPIVFSLSLLACGASERRPEFPLRAPLLRDADLASVYVACRVSPTDKDARHVTCAPEPYDSPLYWDAADNLFFRPLTDVLGVSVGAEAVDVNSMDEVPDSSWFTNRPAPLSAEGLRMGACTPSQLLDPDHAPDGSWLVDKGKGKGSTPGFRINIKGKGKYLIKVEGVGLPERQVAATVIGEAVFHAAGFNASCEQALFVRPSVFKLAPHLKAKQGNFGDEYDFDQGALDAMLAKSMTKEGLVRLSASAWIPGFNLGQFRYEGTRADDPNDVVPHEDRRELRGARLIAAWLDHFDAREGNSLDTWITDVKGGPPDASPGHVVHYVIGTSAALGSVWSSDQLSRRLGSSYIIDWADTSLDFITLGVAKRPWDTAHRTPGQEMFNYMNGRDFDPEAWKNEYPNPAFSRMTERDGAWMARVLSRFTPDLVRELAAMGRFSNSSNTEYLAAVLEERLERILRRYLGKLSPIADVHVEGDKLCGVNLAERRGLHASARFRYAARAGDLPLGVERGADGAICVKLEHASRYLKVHIEDGVTPGALVAHLYDVGVRGFVLVGIERP